MERVELNIYYRDGNETKLRCTVNKWEFQDTMMGEQFITLNITSEIPIDFAVGDFCTFRGETYTLNYVPSVTQKARTNECQDAYTYEHVKFESRQEELTRCVMLDITPTTGSYVAALGTNYTGSSKFQLFCGETTANGSTLTAVCALAAKMQANLDRMFGTNTWNIFVDTTTTYESATGDNVLVTHTEDKVLSFDNTTVAKALEEVHNTFDLDYCIRGRSIYIGFNMANLTGNDDIIANPNNPANDTFSFGYGPGYPTHEDQNKGLFQIKRIANSQQKIVTRLRALGSTKNLPYRYYNKKYSNGNDDLSQTLFPTNLQLPDTFIEEGSRTDIAGSNTKWGHNKQRDPNLRAVKGDTNDAYIDKNDDAEHCAEGIREDSARWDGTNSELPEIYPTIEEATYGELRSALVEDQEGKKGGDGSSSSSAFYPYANDERIDKLLAIGYKYGNTLVDDANKGDGILPESGFSTTRTPRPAIIDSVSLSYNTNDNGDFVAHDGYFSGDEKTLFVIQGVSPGLYAMAPTFGPVVMYGFSITSRRNASMDVGFIINVKQKDLLTGEVRPIATYFSDYTNITNSSGTKEVALPELPDVKNTSTAKVQEIRVTSMSDITVTFTPVIRNVIGEAEILFGYRVGKSRLDNTINYESEYTWVSLDETGGVEDTFHVFVQDMGFDITACWTNDTPVISMKSGRCTGREFEIGENVEKVSYNGKKGYMLTLKRATDNSLNTYYPSATDPIAAGDFFVLLNISMPDVYVQMAEVRLLRAATQYLADNCETQFTYQPSIDDIYLQRNLDKCRSEGREQESIWWRLYAGLKFTFLARFDSGDDENEDELFTADITIEQVRITMGDGLTPKVDLKLNDDIQQSTIQKLTIAVDRIYNGSIFGNGGGGGSFAEMASKLQSLIQSEGEKLFLSKKSSDTAQALITFLKGLKVGNGTYGIDGNGDAILRDINAQNALFTTLTAQEAHFFSLIIDEVKSVGGQLVITPANCTADLVEPVPGEADRVRVFFQAQDGSRGTVNQWEVGDQALHYEFDTTQGTTRNYWRLVVGVSDEPVAKTVDGVQDVMCHWIDLSLSDCKEGSGSVESGDNISMLGNRTDAERQNAIIISAYNIPFIDTAPYLGHSQGIQAPLFASYTGINSFTITEANRLNVIAGNGNLFSGALSVRSTLADGRPVNSLGTEEGNLLRNTAFTGDYESEAVSEDTEMTADTPLWSDPLAHWEHENAQAADSASAKSGRCVSLADGSISQTVGAATQGEWYMLSFFASGDSMTVNALGVERNADLTPMRTRLDIAFEAVGGADSVTISGTCVVSDIILTKGTIPVEWAKSPLDPDTAKREDMANDYLRRAIAEASTTINGGLVLTQMLKMGHYRRDNADGLYKMTQETGGLSGVMNDGSSPYSWGGGTMQQAINAIDFYKADPSAEPTEEDLADFAKFVVTHGGRAILEDVILRGYVYALGGKFKGTVEALSGVFKNITSPNGSFSIDNSGTLKIVNMLVESFGKIACAVFKGDYMISQNGDAVPGNDYNDFDPADPDNRLKFVPNLYLNFLTGKARLVNADIFGQLRTPPVHITNTNFSYYFELYNEQQYQLIGLLAMPTRSIQLEYLPSDHDTVVCDSWITSDTAAARWEGLQVAIINISGQSYKYTEIDNWSAPSIKYSTIGDKTIAQFQLIRLTLPTTNFMFPSLLSLRDI